MRYRAWAWNLVVTRGAPPRSQAEPPTDERCRSPCTACRRSATSSATGPAAAAKTTATSRRAGEGQGHGVGGWANDARPPLSQDLEALSMRRLDKRARLVECGPNPREVGSGHPFSIVDRRVRRNDHQTASHAVVASRGSMRCYLRVRLRTDITRCHTKWMRGIPRADRTPLGAVLRTCPIGA